MIRKPSIQLEDWGTHLLFFNIYYYFWVRDKIYNLNIEDHQQKKKNKKINIEFLLNKNVLFPA